MDESKVPSPSNPRAMTHVIALPSLICGNCGKPYRSEVRKMANGKITEGIADVYCDTCFHGAEVSYAYANAMPRKWAPPARLEISPLPTSSAFAKGLMGDAGAAMVPLAGEKENA